MDTNVLREFLVKIGFQTDRAGLRALHQGLTGVTGAVTGLVKAATGMAAAVTAAVTVTARQFDELYYSSQRAESSAESLLAIGHAARSVGLTAAGVRGQIEGMAASFRDMPPMRSWLQGLTGTQGGTPEQMMEGFARYYRGMMQQGREVYARMVLRAGGMDPETIRQIAMNLPAFMRSREEASAWFRALNFNAGQASEASVNFMREINRSWLLFSTVWDRISLTLLPILGKGLRELNSYVVAHFGDIKQFIDGPLAEFAKWATDAETWKAVRQHIDDLTESFKSLASNVNAVVDGIKWIANGPISISKFVGGVIGTTQQPQQPKPSTGDYLGAPFQSSSWERLWRGLSTGNWTPIARPTEEQKLQEQWLRGQTHSPNVDIYEAQGLWSTMKGWFTGSQVTAPFVNLAEATIAKIRGGGTDAGKGFAPSGEAPAAGAGGSRMPGRMGGMGPQRSGGNQWTAPADTPTGGARGDPRGVLAGLRASATRYGLDPDKVVGVGRAEGLGAKNYKTWDVNGWSFGALQMHTGANGPSKTGRASGLGDAFFRATDLDPSNPKNEIAMNDWAVWYASRHGWHDWSSVNNRLAPNPGTSRQGAGEWKPPEIKPTSLDSRVSPYAAQLAAGSTNNEGDRNVTISPNTTIHVHGDGDPMTTARYVGSAQGRVTAGITRSFQTAAV